MYPVFGNKSTISLPSAMPHNRLFNILARVDSTNNYAMGLVHAGMAEHGMAWFTTDQTAGRGRRSKTWIAQPGENIALSVILQPPPAITGNPFSLSMMAALASYRFFAPLAGDETCLKWPNDLYWRDRKAGGILIENTYQGRNWQWSVVGIGININQTAFGEDAKRPVSLRQITGKQFDATELARHLHETILDTVNEYANTDMYTLSNAYNEHLYRKGQTIRLKKGSQVFDTTVRGVSPQGLLLTRDTMERSWAVDEVELVNN